MVEVVNRQRRHRVNSKRWEGFASRALAGIGCPEGSATIAFVSDRKMRELNREFRGRDAATDVLSFPFGGDGFDESGARQLGDIAISLDRAEAQAREHGLSQSAEVAQLILHGLLHLCGYDHETDQGEMNKLELKLRRRLGI